LATITDTTFMSSAFSDATLHTIMAHSDMTVGAGVRIVAAIGSTKSSFSLAGAVVVSRCEE
jgi:hypothetical protein